MESKEELIQEIEKLFEAKKYQKIIELLSDDVIDKYIDAEFPAWKARAYERLGDLNKALKYIYTALAINDSSPFCYFVLGNIWKSKKKHTEAIENYNKAIELKPDYAQAFNNLGTVYVDLNKYDEAIYNYTRAVDLENDYSSAFNNRGNARRQISDSEGAFQDFNRVIEIDDKLPAVYYNRAVLYKDLNNLEKAIEDYQKYFDLAPDKNDYWARQSIAKIEELSNILTDNEYEELANLVDQIKLLLIFNEKCITHYTTLSVSKILIMGQKNRFRVSEGTFLNDTSEGKELFKYLGFKAVKKLYKESQIEQFAEKPFIGSFVSENKHNNLTLWRMYGKENREEAKGCALTLDRQRFIESIEQFVGLNASSGGLYPSNEFTFYKVAYVGLDKTFIIPGDVENSKKLDDLMALLKQKSESKKLIQQNLNKKLKITTKLNEITYLFKSSEYQYEHEVRLIVSGVGFEKKIEDSPRVYIELADIRHALEKITLGPKVERPDEWAATFNFYLKDYYLRENHKERKIDTIISRIPFK